VVEPNWQDKYVRDALRRQSPMLVNCRTHAPSKLSSTLWPGSGPARAVVSAGHPHYDLYPRRSRAWREGVQGGFETGRIVLGEIELNEEPQDTRWFGPSSTYRFVLVEPIEQVDETWFQVPTEWLDVPAEPG